MAPRSYDKGQSLGKLPACAICAGPGVGGRAELHLPGGVVVWRCAEHRSRDVLTSRTGRDIVASLMHLWRSAGCFDRRRSKALDLHLERIRNALTDPRRPGSYSWPALRRETEERFARGERPAEVIRRLRARHARDHATAPSERTMRRWFSEGRWLAPGPPDGGPPPPPGPPGGGGTPVPPGRPTPRQRKLPQSDHHGPRRGVAEGRSPEPAPGASVSAPARVAGFLTRGPPAG